MIKGWEELLAKIKQDNLYRSSGYINFTSLLMPNGSGYLAIYCSGKVFVNLYCDKCDKYIEEEIFCGTAEEIETFLRAMFYLEGIK